MNNRVNLNFLVVIKDKTNIENYFSTNSHAIGMAVARPYGIEIDYMRNSISKSVA